MRQSKRRVTPVEDVVVEPEETIDSDFSVDNTEESYDEDVMPLPSGEEDATPVYNGDVAQQSSETNWKKNGTNIQRVQIWTIQTNL